LKQMTSLHEEHILSNSSIVEKLLEEKLILLQ
jgi:hypothetical protein